MKNIIVTGANGQLGQELKKLSIDNPDFKLFYTDIDHIDLTDFVAFKDYFDNIKPAFLINCAAYTAVDKAETDLEKAMEMNATVPGMLAKLCSENDSVLFHFSTDFVFDGTKSSPYKETDPTNPLSVYGKSKLEGEKQIIKNAEKYFIIRTSWLYSTFGNNFVKTMLRMGREKDEIRVVYDQTGTPTNAHDLAECIFSMMRNSNNDSTYGIYNFSNEGVCSWYDFAFTIFKMKNISCKIKPVTSLEYVTAAVRPHFSVLDKSKVKDTFGIKIMNWQASLENCLAELQ